eukprot:339330-Alexandrium_andersonii.AAC.1
MLTAPTAKSSPKRRECSQRAAVTHQPVSAAVPEPQANIPGSAHVVIQSESSRLRTDPRRR